MPRLRYADYMADPQALLAALAALNKAGLFVLARGGPPRPTINSITDQHSLTYFRSIPEICARFLPFGNRGNLSSHHNDKSLKAL